VQSQAQGNLGRLRDLIANGEKPMHAFRDVSESTEQGYWKPSRSSAIALRVGSAVMSLALPALTLFAARDLWDEPSTGPTLFVWWAGIGALCTVAFVLAERVGRRAGILADLMQMELAFPGPPPRRLVVTKQVSELLTAPDGVARALVGAGADPASAPGTIIAIASAHSSGRGRSSSGTSGRTTRRHLRRVMEMTDSVAQVLSVPDADRDRLRWAALLHGVGAEPDPGSGSRDASGSRPADASDGSAHPLEPAQIAQPLTAWLGQWALAIAQHHERFDGGGHPAGLRGEQISLGGRILAVTDAFDVMTTSAPGRPALSEEAARSELAGGAGSRFDPVVVRAFLAAPRSGAHESSRLSGLWPIAPTCAASAVAVASRATIALLAATALVMFAGSTPEHGGATVLSAAAVVNGAATATLGPSLARLEGGATHALYGSLQPPGAGARSGDEPGVVPSQQASGRLLGSNSAFASSKGIRQNPTSGPQRDSQGFPVAGTTTTSVPGTKGSSPPPTQATSPPTTTSPVPPTTTTTTAEPPPAAPSNLSAKASCSDLFTAVVDLTWNEAETHLVSSYEIMRKTAQSRYSVIATLPAGRTSYTDTTASGLATTYWYEVEAIGSGAATSSPVEITTPALCV
jgi:HD domain